MKNEQRPIPVDKQSSRNWYAMEIKFAASTVLKSTGLVIPKAATLTLTQTVPFVPDDSTLERYAHTIERSYADAGTNVLLQDVKFAGYASFRAVEPPAGAVEAAQGMYVAIVRNDYVPVAKICRNEAGTDVYESDDAEIFVDVFMGTPREIAQRAADRMDVPIDAIKVIPIRYVD